MNEVQLYINGQRADLFSDEDIVITSSIQNSKEISKIFTDFSQSFTVPASKANNKIFKHYYNADIAVGYNYDARKKVDAIIELNYSHFRNGKIRLDGVQLKQGKPYAYKITFFGSTVTLTDLLGEDLLSDLEGLESYNHDYGEAEVLTGLQSSLLSGNIIYPLISHTNRFFYDSSNDVATGNLYYDAAYPTRGVNYTDLKPALKLSAIISAIQSQYGLTFDSKFFDGTLTGFEDVFPNLFMWLHSKKGALQTSEGEVTRSVINNFEYYDGYSGASLVDGYVFTFQGVQNNDLEIGYTVQLKVTPVEAGTYNIYVYDFGELIGSVLNVSGEQTTPSYDFQDEDPHRITFKIETSGGITNYDAEVTIDEVTVNDTPYGTSVSSTSGRFRAVSQSLISTLSIRENIPNIKVIDFLTNLFKMFNLTSYVKQTGEIYVEPLNTFYQEGATRNISKYINLDEVTVDRAIPYKTIKFEFPESKTFHAEKRNQIFGGTQFGNLVYSQQFFDGVDYSLDVKFEKMVYEKISDVNTSSFTEIGWGWSTDYKGDTEADIVKASSVVGEPLIFFNVSTSASGTPISFFGASHNSVNTYNRPSNVNLAETQTLNFNAEIDEYNLDTNTESLYKRYYETYISQVFDQKARMYTYDSMMPNNLLLNYSINDTFIIGDREYIINTVNTNTRTGKTKLELINKLF